MFKGILVGREGGRASDTTLLADRGTGSGRQRLPGADQTLGRGGGDSLTDQVLRDSRRDVTSGQVTGTCQGWCFSFPESG